MKKLTALLNAACDILSRGRGYVDTRKRCKCVSAKPELDSFSFFQSALFRRIALSAVHHPVIIHSKVGIIKLFIIPNRSGLPLSGMILTDDSPKCAVTNNNRFFSGGRDLFSFRQYG
jgi:hypothetical protein